jgi:hypothetical protein
VNTVSLNDICRRNRIILKIANGMIRSGNAIRYMGRRFLDQTLRPELSRRPRPREHVIRLQMDRRSRSAIASSVSRFLLRLEYLASAVHAGFKIDVMGATQLAGILVLDVARTGKRIGRAPHTAP